MKFEVDPVAIRVKSTVKRLFDRNSIGGSTKFCEHDRRIRREFQQFAGSGIGGRDAGLQIKLEHGERRIIVDEHLDRIDATGTSPRLTFIATINQSKCRAR